MYTAYTSISFHSPQFSTDWLDIENGLSSCFRELLIWLWMQHLGWELIIETTRFCCLALTVLAPLGEEAMRQHSPALGLSMPTLKISNGPLTLTQNLLRCQQWLYSQRQFQTHRNDSNIQKWSCKATWSATARANLSILEPASAIFLAALITSEEFFRGPLPLGKFKEEIWVEMQEQRIRRAFL